MSYPHDIDDSYNLEDGIEECFFELDDYPKHVDDICRKLQWPIARISRVLGILEQRQKVQRVGGGRFKRR